MIAVLFTLMLKMTGKCQSIIKKSEDDPDNEQRVVIEPELCDVERGLHC